MNIVEMIKNENKFCEEEEFVKNEHGVYLYTSKDGTSSFDLPFILYMYKQWLIENDILKEI